MTDAPYNSVLLNYYRNGADSMGLHADDDLVSAGGPVDPLGEGLAVLAALGVYFLALVVQQGHGDGGIA